MRRTLGTRQQECIAIHGPLHNFEVAGRCGLVSRVEERRKQRNENDAGNGPLPRAATGHGEVNSPPVALRRQAKD
jgi:hypothetical protein